MSRGSILPVICRIYRVLISGLAAVVRPLSVVSKRKRDDFAWKLSGKTIYLSASGGLAEFLHIFADGIFAKLIKFRSADVAVIIKMS